MSDDNSIKLLMKDEIEFLVNKLPNNFLVIPLKQNKKYSKMYAPGFRPDKTPISKICNFYTKEISKGNIGINDFIVKIAKDYYRPLIEAIGNALYGGGEFTIEDLSGRTITQEDIDKILLACEENWSVTDIKMASKLYDIVLTPEAMNSLEIEEEVMATAVNEVADNGDNRELQERYERLLHKQERAFRRQLRKLEVDMGEAAKAHEREINALKHQIEEKDGELEEYKKRLEAQRDKYAEAMKEIDHLKYVENNYKYQLKKISDEYKGLEQRYKTLSEEYSKFKTLTLAAAIDSEDIQRIIDEVRLSGSSMRQKFKTYLEDFDDIDKVPEGMDLMRSWDEWLAKEKKDVMAVLSDILINGSLTEEKLAALSDDEMLLHLRIYLIKLIESIGYKYISNAIWQELRK